jgi:hypothetical protein
MTEEEEVVVVVVDDQEQAQTGKVSTCVLNIRCPNCHKPTSPWSVALYSKGDEVSLEYVDGHPGYCTNCNWMIRARFCLEDEPSDEAMAQWDARRQDSIRDRQFSTRDPMPRAARVLKSFYALPPPPPQIK